MGDEGMWRGLVGVEVGVQRFGLARTPKIYVGPLLLFLVAMVLSGCEQSPTRNELVAENSRLEDEVDQLEVSLKQANTNIEDAKGAAGGTFEEMRNALERLETVDKP